MIRRHVLITGGAGFIGYHLASALLAENETDVVLVDDLSRGKLDGDFKKLLQHPAATLIEGDLTEPRTFESLGSGYHEVYHFAGMVGVDNVMKRPHEVLRINAMSTLLLLGWFFRGGGEKILFSSTSEVYAWTQSFFPLPIPTPENVPLALTEMENPRSTYAATKIFGEHAVTQFATEAQKPFTIVRFHNVYGPRMGEDHVIPQIARRAMGGQNPLVIYSPTHTRAFCYVSDAISGVVAAMRNSSANGRTLNIGNNKEEVSIGDLASRITSSLGLTRKLEFADAPHDPVVRRCPDITKAASLIGYEPRISLNVGLGLTLKWYANPDNA